VTGVRRPAGQELPVEGLTIREITRRTADGLVVSGRPWRESYRPAGFLHGGAVASIVASSGLAAARELTGQPALCLRSIRLAYFAPSTGAMVEIDAAMIGRYGPAPRWLCR
jgi:acyl-coenzyme A thioesterase PaaI-like protein